MKVLILWAIVAVAFAEVIDLEYCSDVESKCTISEVRLTPCKNKKACRIVKGSDAELSFDFIPTFTTSSLKTSVTYNGAVWDAINTDACTQTKCPTEAGQQQTYNAKMHIGKKLPSGDFKFRWAVTDANDESNTCCIHATVRLPKTK